MNPFPLLTPEVAYSDSKISASLPITQWTSPAEAFQARPTTQGNFVVLCTAGSLEFQASDKLHTLTAGDAVVIAAGQSLTLLSATAYDGQLLEIAPLQTVGTVDNSVYDALFLQFVELVKKYHYQYIKFYCQQLGLQPAELHTYCQHNSGMAPKAWLHGYLLLEAKDLLRGKLSISETAKYLGFLQLSHFSAWFSQHARMSPYAWKYHRPYRR